MIANSIYKVNYFFSIYYSKNDYMGSYLFLRFILNSQDQYLLFSHLHFGPVEHQRKGTMETKNISYVPNKTRVEFMM